MEHVSETTSAGHHAAGHREPPPLHQPHLTDAHLPMPSLQGGIVHPDSSSELPIKLSAGPPRMTKSTCSKMTLPARHMNVLNNEPIASVKRDKAGCLQGVYHTWGIRERIRSTASQEERAATALLRRVGTCFRCRRQKKGCTPPSLLADIYKPCKHCAAMNPLSLKEPCVRFSILQLMLHRRGSTRDDAFDKWLDHQKRLAFEPESSHSLTGSNVLVEKPHVVTITQDRGLQFDVVVNRFQPENGDVTYWKWKDDNGIEREMDMPPYYISDMCQATNIMSEAAFRNHETYIDALLRDANPIVSRTFAAALQFQSSSKSILVSRALAFWVATRFIEHPWRICGGALPPFEPPMLPSCPYNGIVPVTPIMDTQIDHIALRDILLPLGKKILGELEEKIKTKKRENWFEIFLATFIIMNNFEFIFADIVEYTKRHGIKENPNGPPSLSHGFYQACKTILVYFHFACSGQSPLSLRLAAPQVSHEVLTPDQIAYLRDVQVELMKQAEERNDWKTGSMYDTPMYWCYQILDDNWDSTVTPSLPIDSFTEEDFLTS